jgi:hypothetical protein
VELELVTETLLAKLVEGVLVEVMGDAPPKDADWDAGVAFSARLAPQCMGILVWAGAGPNSAQRARIAKIDALKDIPTAIVSSSAVVRGIATAFSWLGKKVKGFAPAQIDDALDFLNVPAAVRPVTVRQLDELRTRLAGRRAS